MSIEKVKEYFRDFGMEERVLRFETSSATVELAARALGVKAARIAKTISFKNRDNNGCILVVTAGDTKIDNAKFKNQFGVKAKMLTPDEVLEFTGFPVGGVCPFGIDKKIPVHLDISLKRFDTVFPACGSTDSAIEMTTDELQIYSNAVCWVDVCKTTGE